MATCLHENVSPSKDMPMCDVEGNFVGRFDVEICDECGETISKVETDVPPPVLIEGRDFIPQ